MILRRLFETSFARILALCVCLGMTSVVVAGCGSREERAQTYYDRGMGYLEKKDYVKARIELRNAIQRKADFLPAWKALAEIDEHDQNIQALAGTLRRITELDPNDVNATVKLARLYLLGNALDRALKLADAAGELDPKNADILALKASILYRLKDQDGTVKTAQAALAIDPGNSAANVVLAATKFSQGDFKSALNILANVSKGQTDDLGVVLMKVNIFTQMGDIAQAEALLRKLVDSHPEIPVFRTQLIQFYLRQKRPDDAVKVLRSVAAANPSDVATEMQLVNLLGALKGADGARTELQTRIKNGGNVFPYQIALAKLEFSQGKIDDSVKLLEQLIGSATTPDDTTAAKITLAEIYVSRNNDAAAEPLITDVLKADSHNTAALRLRASLHLKRNKLDDAIADLRSALNYQPRSPELLSSLAIVYERGGQMELAEKSFFEATKASNYAPPIGLSYVAFLKRRGMTAQAENIVNELASRNENSIPVLTALAQSKLERQDWAGAHAIAESIHRLGDKSDLADQINAAAYGGQGKIGDSLAILQNAYQSNPGAVRPMVDLVRVYLQSGQLDQAESFLRSVLKDNPENAEALVLMGGVQLAKKAPAEAESYFKTAIAKKPADVAGYRALVDLYLRQNKKDQAMTVVDEGLKRLPDNFALRLIQTGLIEAKGDYEAAIANYEAMLKEQPGSLIIANNLASLLTDHRTDKASLDRAYSIALVLKNSQAPQFMDTLGWVSYLREDYRAALPLLESATKAMPNLAVARYHLGMTYLATGQDAKASEQFAKARELAPNDKDLHAKIDAALKNRPEKAKG